MRRLLCILCITVSLSMLILDAAAGRFGTLRHVYDREDLDRRLLSAVDRTGPGGARRVAALLRQGADVECRDERDETPLYLAVNLPRHKDQEAVVRLLIANGADVNASKKYPGNTPLFIAALRGYREIAEILVANGADVNALNEEGDTPLHYAANELVVAELWTSGFIPSALEADQGAVAELLIAHGADVNAKNKAGRTPLDSAEETNRIEIAKVLRDCGGKTGKETE